jgi:cytochrome c oxidase subunit IV
MADHAHPPEQPHAAEHATSSRKSYLVIFGLLFLLTLLEVGVASPSLGISKTGVVSALVLLALTKAVMVAYYFMHLKHEMRALRWTVLLPFAFPAIYAFVLIAEAAWRLLR